MPSLKFTMPHDHPVMGHFVFCSPIQWVFEFVLISIIIVFCPPGMKTARLCLIVFIVFLVAHSHQAQARSQFFQAGIFQKNTTRVQKSELITEVDITGNRYGITFAVIELMPPMKLVMAASEILSIKNLLKKPYPASFIQ